MAKKSEPKNEELFPQKRIPAIESAIVAADKKRAEIEEQQEIVAGLQEELKPLERDLKEALHKYDGQVDQQKTEGGDLRLIYEHGEYRAEVKSHERLSYDKVRTTDGGE